MREPKFTPGPWEAGKNACMTTILDGHEGKAVYSKESSYHIAWANAENSDGDLDIETALANAALIAAAPEMYHALELECVCCKLRDHETDCGHCAIGAAIRKARGEREVENDC